MVVLDENDKKLIPYENILSLLTEIKGYPTFGETEFNLVAPLFDDLGDIQNKGYETFNCFPFYTIEYSISMP